MQNGMDLHIAAVRQGLESTYGQLFADAVGLRSRLDESSLSDAEYDAGVVGLVGSAILTVRPMPSHLRGAIGGLLGVVHEDRSELVKFTPPGGREIEMRSDHMWIEVVVKCLGLCLYPAESYIPRLTDNDCGEGAREILAAADANGIIWSKDVSWIREKLAALDAKHGRSVVSNDRRVQLVALVESAYSTGSALVCIPSKVREARLALAGLIPIRRTGLCNTSPLLPTERTAFDQPQIYPVMPRR